MLCRIGGIECELPEEVVTYLRVNRYRDSKRKNNVISVRFTTAELQQLEKWHRTSDSWKSFSVFLHDILLKALAEESLSKVSTKSRRRWWK